MGFFDRLKAGLAKTREKLADKIDELLNNTTKIDDELLDELEETLIMSDVGTKTTEKLMENLRKGIRKAEINSPQDVKIFLSNQIRELLIEEEGDAVNLTPPHVILMIYDYWQVKRVLFRTGQKSYGCRRRYFSRRGD